jgi:hypothetical protein
MPAQLKGITDTGWIGGANSLLEPGSLQQGEYQWGANIINRAGLISTRPGFALIGQVIWGLGEPQAMTVFFPRQQLPQMILAVGGKILKSIYPFRYYEIIPGIEFSKTGPIHFCSGIKSVDRANDGTLKVVDSTSVLVIQDGKRWAALWDGISGRHVNPATTPAASYVPVGTHMAWAGNRLWVASGTKLYASDIADPTRFFETQRLNSGGYFSLPGEISGVGQTQDLRTLIVGTETTVTTFLANIRNRDVWADTPDFQKVLLPGIGVVSGRSFVNQYGLTWWMSQGGLIGLDNAQQTYRSSRINYRDQNMMRSKSNLSRDLTRVCGGSFENFLLMSVPSGDIHNAHTWVLDQSPIDTPEQPGQPSWSGIWTGVRPVQWVTAVIQGKTRCFCLSRDYVPGFPTEYTYNVWEAFIPERCDVNHNKAPKQIACGFETRRMAEDPRLKRFSYAQLDLTEIMGKVRIQVFYAGLKGGYEQILDKTIIATDGSLGAPTEDAMIDGSETTIQFYRPQDRLIRTKTVKGGKDDNDVNGVESRFNRNIDRGFSLLVKWTGQMSIRALEIFYLPESEAHEGTCEPDETTERAVTLDGVGKNSSALYSESAAIGINQSQSVRVITPRYVEDGHQSLLPNYAVEAVDSLANTVFSAPIIPRAPEPNMTRWIDPAPTPVVTPIDPTPTDENPPKPYIPIDWHPPNHWPPYRTPPNDP